MIHQEPWIRFAAFERELAEGGARLKDALREIWLRYQRMGGESFPDGWFHSHAFVLAHYGLLANSDFTRLKDVYGHVPNAFYETDVSGSDFSWTRLNFNFYGSNLTGAKFDGADILSGANFHSANLTNASFRDAIIGQSTNFKSAIFNNTDLRGATFHYDWLDPRTLKGVIL